jgi:16S rRNA processing protein RimM
VSGRVVLGQVVGAHALRGQIRVRYFGDGPDNLLRLSAVWLAASRDTPQSDFDFYEVTFSGLGRRGEARLGLQGVSDRDAAEELRGLLVLTEEDQLEPAVEGEYYWHQLIGCQVETHEGRRVGIVREVRDTGAHDLLVVTGDDDRVHLIPTSRELMTEVDLERRRIVVQAIPGLLDLN